MTCIALCEGQFSNCYKVFLSSFVSSLRQGRGAYAIPLASTSVLASPSDLVKVFGADPVSKLLVLLWSYLYQAHRDEFRGAYAIPFASAIHSKHLFK